jgi:Tfp pilus assembly PilM family ATPase
MNKEQMVTAIIKALDYMDDDDLRNWVREYMAEYYKRADLEEIKHDYETIFSSETVH